MQCRICDIETSSEHSPFAASSEQIDIRDQNQVKAIPERSQGHQRGHLKGIPLCDLHREWAVEVMVKIKSAEFEEIPGMLNKLPIRKAEPCEK